MRRLAGACESCAEGPCLDGCICTGAAGEQPLRAAGAIPNLPLVLSLALE